MWQKVSWKRKCLLLREERVGEGMVGEKKVGAIKTKGEKNDGGKLSTPQLYSFMFIYKSGRKLEYRPGDRFSPVAM